MKPARKPDSLAPRDPLAGANNLLRGCAGARAGERVLLIVEPANSTHYDPAVARLLAQVGRDQGMHIEILEATPASGPDSVATEVMQAIERADRTIFLNRLGDQLRFAPLPGAGTKVMCYALDLQFLGSGFAVTPHALLERIHDRLLATLNGATRYSIRCPLGTDLSMPLAAPRIGGRAGESFTVKNFPIMIVPPIPGDRLTGRLVLSQALTSTYVHPYPDSVLPLEAPLSATVTQGRIVKLEGTAADTARATEQFERVAGLFGGDTWAVNSWHAGINPLTFFPRPALSDIDRWSCVAFGSPRYAHFHMCGPRPGEICGQIFDPTIAFDDTVLWDHGRPAFIEPDARRELAQHIHASPDVLDQPCALGIGQVA